jgi:hypothetical protein
VVEVRLKARWSVALLTVLYTVGAFALVNCARDVSLPTRGGISASEVLQGVVPGGISTLLIVWVALVILTVVAWLRHLRKHTTRSP